MIGLLPFTPNGSYGEPHEGADDTEQQTHQHRQNRFESISLDYAPRDPDGGGDQQHGLGYFHDGFLSGRRFGSTELRLCNKTKRAASDFSLRCRRSEAPTLGGAERRYIGRLFVVKTPRMLSPLTRIVHADTRTAAYLCIQTGRRLQPERVA